MEKMSEAYNEIFLEGDARVIIPAVRYLITMCKVRDEATAYFEKLYHANYPVFISEKIVPEIVIQMAKDLQAACYAEVFSAEDRVRETLREALEKTFVKQMDLLGFGIELSSEDMSYLIKKLEGLEFLDPYRATDEEVLREIIDGISVNVWYMSSYDDEYLMIDDVSKMCEEDNALFTKMDIIDAISSVEDYLAELKNRLEELEKEESKNFDENAEYEEK